MHQVVKERILEYHSFVSIVTNQVMNMMGDDYHIQVYKVTKNNSMILDSLVICRKERNSAPNIYLMPYYESYLAGTEIMEIVERICRVYDQYANIIEEEKINYSFDTMKQFIIYRLVSYERNRKLLSQIPHVKYLDLAITFHCVVRNNTEGIGTIRITNDHMETWKTSVDTLSFHAVQNTGVLFPSSLHSMEDMIMGLMPNQSMQSCKSDDIYQNQLNQSVISSPTLPKNKIYILTNQKGIHGASCILYENVLSKFASQIHSDYFILPSSIHEIILVPASSNRNKKVLEQMVQDVNRKHVAQDEILSDRVYYYSRAENAIIM
jgi:hypothetical protein